MHSYISVHYISIVLYSVLVLCICKLIFVLSYMGLVGTVYYFITWVVYEYKHMYSYSRTCTQYSYLVRKYTAYTCMYEYTSKDNLRKKYRTLVRLYEYTALCTDKCIVHFVQYNNKIKLVYVAPATGTFQLTHSEYFANHVTFGVPWVVPDNWFLTSHVFWSCDILHHLLVFKKNF